VVWKLPNKHLPLACLLGGFVAFLSHLASAAPLPVALRPAHFEIAASPGDQVKATVYFYNGTDAELPVHMESEDIRPQDEEGHVAGEVEDAVNSLKDWVKPVYPDVVVFPKQEIPLDFAIDVPANADPGSHWGGVLVRTAPVLTGGGAAIQTRVGTIVLLRVSGEAKEKLALESVSLPRFAESPPITLEARFKNEGTVHEAPQGKIEVRNVFGWLVATGTLPVRNVWPGDVRKIEASVGEGLWLGRYTVLFRATYGDGKDELVARRIIWVAPWRTQGWKVLLGIGILAFVIWKRRNFGGFWYTLRTGKPPPEDY
jgi:hypothetical protein